MPFSTLALLEVRLRRDTQCRPVRYRAHKDQTVALENLGNRVTEWVDIGRCNTSNIDPA